MTASPLSPGDKVRLRSSTLPYVKIREWTFKEVLEDGKVLLEHRQKTYLLEVDAEDIEREREREREQITGQRMIVSGCCRSPC